jgi:hypothetical protein
MPQEKRVTAEPAMGLPQVVDQLPEKGMLRLGHHQVVGKAERFRSGDDGCMGAEEIATFRADDVEIGIDPPELVEDEIPGRIDPLDRAGIVPVGLDEPGIPLGDEALQVRIGPEDVLPVRVEPLPGGDGVAPAGGDFPGLPGLVDDFRDHGRLPALPFPWRIDSRKAL